MNLGPKDRACVNIAQHLRPLSPHGWIPLIFFTLPSMRFELWAQLTWIFPNFCLTWSSSTSTWDILGILAEAETLIELDSKRTDRHRGTSPDLHKIDAILKVGGVAAEKFFRFRDRKWLVLLFVSCFWAFALFVGDLPRVLVLELFRSRLLEDCWACAPHTPLQDSCARVCEQKLKT